MLTIESYLEAKRLGLRHAGKAGSANTLKAYRHALQRAEYLLEKPLAEFTQDDGDRLMTLMEEAGFENAHKANILAALRGAFAYGIGTKIFEGDDPVGGIATPTVKRKLPTILTKEQLNSLYDSFEHERERLLFKLMYFGGLRIGEAVKLRVDHVTADAIIVQGKGNKERRTRLPQHLMNELHQFIRKNNVSAYVFAADAARPLHVSVFYDAFEKAKHVAAVPNELVPHNLRHTSATHMMKATNNVAVVQTFLGHERPETTMIYVQLADEDLDNAHLATFGD